MSSYAHVVHTTAKQVISRRTENENVFKMSKSEKCTCKACKTTVFHCQICKFLTFLLPSSSWLLRLHCVVYKVRSKWTGSRVLEANIENKIFTLTVMCSHYRKALKFQNLTSSFGRLRETIRLWWCCTYGTHLNTVDYSACRTWSTIISLHSTNHIFDLCRCPCRCRRHLLYSLSIMSEKVQKLRNSLKLSRIHTRNATRQLPISDE